MKIYGPDTIIVVRAPLVIDDRDNSYFRDWENATLTTYGNCMVEPYRMAEKLNSEESIDREFVSTSIRIFAPPTVDVLYTDRIRISTGGYDGIEFAVLGLPGRWHDLQGSRVYKGIIAQARLG